MPRARCRLNLPALGAGSPSGLNSFCTRRAGESLDECEVGLVVVVVSDMEAKVRSAMKRVHEVEEKQLKADQKELKVEAA
jgi:hypothetical protein